jgi:hypothetical protein
MRSRIDIKTRLAAHITAVFFLVVILSRAGSYRPVDSTVPEMANPSRIGIRAFGRPETSEMEQPAPPETPAISAPVKMPETAVAVQPPEEAEAPAKPELEQPALPETPAISEPVKTPETAVVVQPSEEENSSVSPTAPDSGNTVDSDATVSEISQSRSTEKDSERFLAVRSQPDESGALEVAEGDPADHGSEPVLAPLADGGLEVLGDGVYWLSSRRDLIGELAAVPEAKTLVLLAPDGKFETSLPDGLRTEIIPAGMGDIGIDAAEHFLTLVDGEDIPLVIAALPDTGAAAFFKGVYLLVTRGKALDDVFKTIAPDLPGEGKKDEEIRHRLSRLREDMKR